MSWRQEGHLKKRSKTLIIPGYMKTLNTASLRQGGCGLFGLRSRYVKR